jgi:hypothetical protein
VIAFLACVERGPLEPKTVLLCRSIRTFAGRFRNAPIHTFRPRAGPEIGDDTRASLTALGVTHHDDVLNTEFSDYPEGNKVFVSAHAERTLREDVLVFLDSDTIFVAEPADLDLPDSFDAAVRPAYSRDLNSYGHGDSRDGYWSRVLQFLRVDREPYVTNEFSETVRAYFSSGLIAARREAGLFGRWQSDFLTLARAGLLPTPSGIKRLDEIALACTMSRVFERVRLLDGRYNYLIYYRSRLPAPWGDIPLEGLIHVHYRYWFNRPHFLRDLRPPLDPLSPVARWLDAYLPLEPHRTQTPMFPFEEPDLASPWTPASHTS